jgi:hypothetical protein
MGIEVYGQVGPSALSAGDGANIEVRQGRSGEMVVQELHGRFYEQTYRGNVYSGGMTLTSISAATFTSATTGATATPIAGVWNPAGSQVNAVLLQAALGVTLTALQATGAGPYVWMVAPTTAAISTAKNPFNRKTLTAAGGSARDLSGVALTGMTGTLAVMGASALGGGSASNAAFLGTAASMQATFQGFVENLDGSIIVPPGYLAVLMATTTPVAHSAASTILWEEVPL